mmetsp:Transcript_23219/g.46212  ORF Transcript_23219/g.46212 Transcript_23219/m.46212 type:complete len:176 (-) Transcript_23219:62-589(-)
MNPNGSGGFEPWDRGDGDTNDIYSHFDVVQMTPASDTVSSVAFWAGRGEGGLRLWGVDPHTCDGCNNNMFSGDRNQWDHWTTGWSGEVNDHAGGVATWTRLKDGIDTPMKFHSSGSDGCMAYIDTSKCEENIAEIGWAGNDCGETCSAYALYEQEQRGEGGATYFTVTCENWPGV